MVGVVQCADESSYCYRYYDGNSKLLNQLIKKYVCLINMDVSARSRQKKANDIDKFNHSNKAVTIKILYRSATAQQTILNEETIASDRAAQSPLPYTIVDSADKDSGTVTRVYKTTIGSITIHLQETAPLDLFDKLSAQYLELIQNIHITLYAAHCKLTDIDAVNQQQTEHQITVEMVDLIRPSKIAH